ncbi:hypothetical protein C8R47DRAFT_1229733 [Mycena vitilis]|nr:hypothetical protein C8R47DRAFT_1229733 [Mycena vitilis]
MRACPARLISVSALASATLLVRSHDPHMTPRTFRLGHPPERVAKARFRPPEYAPARAQRRSPAARNPPCLITKFKIVSWRLSASFWMPGQQCARCEVACCVEPETRPARRGGAISTASTTPLASNAPNRLSRRPRP